MSFVIFEQFDGKKIGVFFENRQKFGSFRENNSGNTVAGKGKRQTERKKKLSIFIKFIYNFWWSWSVY